jgi:rhodanese-related sulfurtransferase
MSEQYAKEIEAAEVRRKLESGEKLNIIDVREPDEWASGHIPGAKHIPLGTIVHRLNELDRDKEYIVVCRAGARSAMACEYLEAMGYKVTNMADGMLQWDGELEYGD